MPDTISPLSDTAVNAMASELKDDENVKAKTYPPCYAFLATGFHAKNMDTMKQRFFRAADKYVATAAAVAAPVHFLCQHCFQRHAIDVAGVNAQMWNDPDPRNRSSNYDHLIFTIVNQDPDGAASAGEKYRNAFSRNTEVEFWDVIGKDPLPPDTGATTTTTPTTASSTSGTTSQGSGGSTSTPAS